MPNVTKLTSLTSAGVNVTAKVKKMKGLCLIGTFLLFLIQNSVEQSTNSQVMKYNQIEVMADSWNSMQISAPGFSGKTIPQFYEF